MRAALLGGRRTGFRGFLVGRLIGLLFGVAACTGWSLAATDGGEERQLTHRPQQHILTNIGVWSPDGQWIVYDTRPAPDRFEGTCIEQVNVETGEVREVYQSGRGAGCGVATSHPREGSVIFILGPEHPEAGWTYAFSRRRGVMVDTKPGSPARALDAAVYAPPFVPGALRGGSHVHVYSPDGKLVSFTYDDEVLTQARGDHDPNQRNVGVTVVGSPVRSGSSHPRNLDGEGFSVLVTRTVAEPRPGSDEISRACEEGWIGTAGYLRPDGSRQQRALAFQGTVTARDGSQHAEVFVVDLPDDLTCAGDGPLEGTSTRRPLPPAGTVQRRLTFTDGERWPGVQGPRHWLRSAPDGSQIAFLKKDDKGIVQLWLVSPNGGPPRQLTRNPWDVSSAFSWSPDGKYIAHAMDRSIFATEVSSGRSVRLTQPSDEATAPQPYACVFSPRGDQIAFLREIPEGDRKFLQICRVRFTVPPAAVPESNN